MRISKRQRILNLAVQKGFSGLIVNMLSAMLEFAGDKGTIYRYVLKLQDDIVSEIFNGDYTEYISAYKVLLKGRFIELRGVDLYILAWNREHLSCLIFNQPCRKYSKNTVMGQKTIDDILNRPPGISSPKEDTSCGRLKINWERIRGVRVPRSMCDLFSGKLDDNEFSYSKEKIRYLLRLIHIADTNNRIYDFNTKYCCDVIRDVFEAGTVACSTCYYAHGKLLKEGTIREYDTDRGKCVVIEGYEEGFREGYIVVSCFVFKKVFKNLETAAVKVAFDTLYKLNNGDDGKDQ